MFHQRILRVNYPTYLTNKEEGAMELVFSVLIIL